VHDFAVLCWNAALDAALDTGIMSGEVEADSIRALKVEP
jgi:hypothetical protein